MNTDTIHPEPLAYSVADASRVSSLCKTRIYGLIREGRLDATKIGKRTVIPSASLRRLIDGEAIEPSADQGQWGPEDDGNEIIAEFLAASPRYSLGPPPRLILLLLAGEAVAETRLAWCSHTYLRKISGLSETTVRNSIAGLVKHGLISIWRRPGRVPLYVVHPHGRATLPAFDRSAAEKHLRKSQFNTDEQASVLNWLSGLHCPR